HLPRPTPLSPIGPFPQRIVDPEGWGQWRHRSIVLLERRVAAVARHLLSLANVMILFQDTTLRQTASFGHRFSFEEAIRTRHNHECKEIIGFYIKDKTGLSGLGRHWRAQATSRRCSKA